MAEGDISALRDMLCSQQRLLRKLYNELDAEREASSTAASEALSVILRLQGEKAAVKMEAEQYKRMAEEKINHAEESLEIFEDVIYQKEMELADLDYQLRACRYKLLSMGCTDPSVGEERLPENHSRNETPASESSLRSIGRRNSTPVLLKSSYPKKGITDKDESTDSNRVADEKTRHELNDQALFNEKKIDNIATGDINSYWEQIRLLEDQVKEIAGVDYGSSRNDTRSPTPLSSQLRTRSPSPQLSASNSFGPKIVTTVNENAQTKSLKNSLGCNSTMGSPGSVNVHDVFEVPRVEQNHKACDLQAKDEIKTACQGNESVDEEGCVHPEAVKLCDEVEPVWLKKLLKAIHPENHLSTVDCRLAIDRPTTSISELNQRIGGLEILDSERPSMGQEATNRTEELKLLNEIKEQINSLHSEIRSWEMKNLSCQKQEPSLIPLMEGMLHFWL